MSLSVMSLVELL